MIEQCILHLNNDKIYDAFPTLLCLEQKFQKGFSPSQGAQMCITNSTIFNQVQQCATGDLGNQLMHKNAVETAALQPPHKYVPWVVVDGVPTDAITDDMLGWICDHYKGPKPSACSSRNKCLKDF